MAECSLKGSKDGLTWTDTLCFDSEYIFCLASLESKPHICAVQAVYAFQGPDIQKDIAELQRSILDAQQVLETAVEQLQKDNVVSTCHLHAVYILLPMAQVVH